MVAKNSLNEKNIIRYEEIPLARAELPSDPIALFELWFTQAKQQGESEPSAMTLATVTRDYDISARMVLLKQFDVQGFCFFTNYLSPKAQALNEIPKASLVFWWPLCQRQIRIKGDVVLLEPAASDQYFALRDKASQIATLSSLQSSVIPDRQTLLTQFEHLTQMYANQSEVPRPPTWGGYRLQHHTVEFWQGRPHRLHDRFQYQKYNDMWQIVQLSP